jgi:hypothetical protein
MPAATGITSNGAHGMTLLGAFAAASRQRPSRHARGMSSRLMPIAASRSAKSRSMSARVTASIRCISSAAAALRASSRAALTALATRQVAAGLWSVKAKMSGLPSASYTIWRVMASGVAASCQPPPCPLDDFTIPASLSPAIRRRATTGWLLKLFAIASEVVGLGAWAMWRSKCSTPDSRVSRFMQRILLRDTFGVNTPWVAGLHDNYEQALNFGSRHVSLRGRRDRASSTSEVDHRMQLLLMPAHRRALGVCRRESRHNSSGRVGHGDLRLERATRRLPPLQVLRLHNSLAAARPGSETARGKCTAV